MEELELTGFGTGAFSASFFIALLFSGAGVSDFDFALTASSASVSYN